MPTARRVTVFGGVGAPTASLAANLDGLADSVEVIALPRRSDEPVEPPEFAQARAVELALRADPPDVVIAAAGGAPAYTALRLRQAGLAFEQTSFVIVSEERTRDASGLAVLEEASAELADVVVANAARAEAELLGVLRPAASREEERRGDERVDVVVVQRDSEEALSRCLSALEQQSFSGFDVFVTASREAGLRSGSAPQVVFLDEADVPAAGLLETLVRARRASGVDVVSCGLHLVSGDTRRLHLFAGEAGGLGAVANAYGNVALYPRALVEGVSELTPAARDPDWPLLAQLAVSGALIVSVPLPLVERSAEPGSVEDDPAGAVLVAQHFDRALPDPLQGAARLVAGLAADAAERRVTRPTSLRRRRGWRR
jgi:hypothetical protein